MVRNHFSGMTAREEPLFLDKEHHELAGLRLGVAFRPTV